MNKKVLSALLFSALFAGTGTFTSCIDNDEPAGLEEIRGAKAELIKAQAAFELAEEAHMRAQVANQELLNKAKELENKRYEIETELSEIAVELKKLELEKQQAVTAQAVAEAEAKIAKAQADKLFWEQQMALESEKFKESMANAERLTLIAQQELEQAIAEAELAKLTMSEAEKKTVQAAIDYVTNAADILGQKHFALISAQKNFDKALLGEAGGQSLSKLTAALAKEQAALGVQEVLLQEVKDMLEFAKSFDAEEWTTKMAELKSKLNDAEKAQAAAYTELAATYVGSEYQKADDAYIIAANALGLQEMTKGYVAQSDITIGAENYKEGEYVPTQAGTATELEDIEDNFASYDDVAIKNVKGEVEDNEAYTLVSLWAQAAQDAKAAQEGGTPEYKKYEVDGEATDMKFTIEKWSSKEVPAALHEFFTKAGIDLDADNKFSYDEDTYVEGVVGAKEDKNVANSYQLDLVNIAAAQEDEEVTLNSYAAKTLDKVEGWVEALGGFTPDANGQEWLKFLLEDAEEKAEAAKAAYEADKAEWTILAKAVKGTKTDAGTEYQVKNENGVVVFNANIKAEVAAYNTVIANIAAAIKANNDALDAWKAAEKALYDAKYEATVTELKNKTLVDMYIDLGKKELATAGKTAAWDALVAADLANKQNMDDLLKQIKETLPSTTYALAEKAAADYYKSTIKDGKEQNEKLNKVYDAAKEAGTNAVKADYAAGDKSTLQPLKDVVVGKGETKATATLLAESVDFSEVDLTGVYANYINHLANCYGQVVVGKNLTNYTDATKKLPAVGAEAYVDNDGNPDWTVINADLGLSTDGYAIKTVKENNATKNVTYTSLAGGDAYYYYVAKGSDISADELANLTKTEIKHELAVSSLATKSSTVFGTAFDWSNTEARLVEITEAEITAHLEENDNNVLATEDTDGTYLVGDYGTLGVKMFADEQVQLYTDMQGAEELVAPIKAEIEAQLAVLKAEIAANSAAVAAYVKAEADAKAAVLAGQKAVETALATRDALAADKEAAYEAAVDLVEELTVIKATAESQFANLAPEGTINQAAMTPQRLVAYWTEEVAVKAELLETKKSKIAEIEKAIELFEAGNYSEAYNVALYKGWLETAQKEYDAAYAVYEAAAKQLDAIIEALLK